jgi:methyl-accepting chemotaxis protein
MIERVAPDFLRRSYLLKFGLAIVLIIGAIGVVGVVTYAQTVDQLESSAEEDYTAVAELGAVDLERWLGEREATLVTTSNNDVYDSSQFLIQDYIRQQSNEQYTPEAFLAYHYIDVKENTIIASAGPENQSQDSTFDRSWHQDNRRFGDSTFVSPVYVEDGIQKVDIATDAVGANTLVMELNFTAFASNMTQPTDGSFTAVVGPNGTVMGSDNSELIGESYGNATWSQIDTGNSTTGFLADQQLSFTDDQHLVAYATMPDRGMTVLVNVPVSGAYTLSGDIAQNLLVIVAVAILGLGLLGVTLVRGTVRDLDTLTTKVETLESGDLDVELSTSRIDEIGQLYDGFAGMRDSLQDRISEAEQALDQAEQAKNNAETARQDAEKAREEAQQVNQHLEEKADEYREVMEACADGDLTRRLDPDSENEAMAEIATAFNEMLDNIERTVAAVSEFATDVESASDDVTDVADQVVTGGRETSQSVDEIAEIARAQQSQLQQVSTEMENMSASIEEVTASANQVASTSQTAAELSEEGQAAALDAVDKLHTIEQHSGSAAQAIQNLDDEMERIDAIVDTITEIADRVNMLALNASIEAARAGSGSGDAGDGFAVVADEVKALAEETQESAGEVETLIEQLREQTAESVSEMTAIQEEVTEGVETVESAEDALSEIAGRVTEANEGVQEISEAMDAQSRSAQEVSESVDDVAATSQETTDEAAAVSERTEQQVHTLQDIATQTGDLSERASRLRERVEEFTVTHGAADDAAAETPVVSDGAGEGVEGGDEPGRDGDETDT